MIMKMKVTRNKLMAVTITKKSKQHENLNESDGDLDDESTNNMLAQVVSVKASSGSTGQKVCTSHFMLTKDRSEHKT